MRLEVLKQKIIDLINAGKRNETHILRETYDDHCINTLMPLVKELERFFSYRDTDIQWPKLHKAFKAAESVEYKPCGEATERSDEH